MHFRRMVFMFLLSLQGNFVQYVSKVISLMHVIGNKRCLATSSLIVRRYYVIIENRKELFVA